MMDNVPVKIAERYKPPPQIRQHGVLLNLNKYKINCFNESPGYQYDFQLERKVLATIPEWRRMRQLNIEARRERIEKRKLLKVREYEEKQMRLLGAVSYPSAEDLSSSSLDSGDDDKIRNDSDHNASPEAHIHSTDSKQIQNVNSFYNILQPTILNRTLLEPTKNYENPGANSKQTPVGNNISTVNINAFDYKDFEEDTSSPFDNIELKTINDLDILAQVLHNTQIKDKSDNGYILMNQQNSKCEVSPTVHFMNPAEENSNEIYGKTIEDESTLQNMEPQNQNISLEKINFNNLDKFLENNHIPLVEHKPEKTICQHIIHHSQPCQYFPKVTNEQTMNGCYGLNQLNMQHLQTTNANSCDEDLTYNPNYNATFSSTAQHMKNQHNNIAHFNFSSLHNFESENGAKSRSVPDIIRELSQEVCKSEQRRTRNYSQNMDGNLSPIESMQAITSNQTASSMLSPETQDVIRNISSMGFSAERVSNLVKIIGPDDKKIIEHLIPLTELMDLGFEESKISEALLKFENNKEKALDYLIS